MNKRKLILTSFLIDIIKNKKCLYLRTNINNIFPTPFIFLYCWPLFIATLFIELIVLVQVYELINRIYIEGSGIISNLNKSRKNKQNHRHVFNH